MGIILDIAMIAILILSIILGYKKGLVGVIFNLCALIVALVITFVLYTPITNWVMNNTQFYDNIKNTIIENGVIEEKENEEEESTLDKYIQKYVEERITDTTNDVVEASAGVIAEKVIAIAVAIILFLVVRIVLIFAKFLIEGIANLPIIKQFNELGGFAYGILRGLVIIYVILAILFFVVSVNNSGIIANAIDSSIISKVLYENNIILNIIF